VEKMVQVLEKERVPEFSFKIEEVIIVEELPMEEEQHVEPEVSKRETAIKRALLKLFKKAKYNAKYLEETIPIEEIKRKIYYRNRGVY
jgi:hypothetical protein